MYSTISLSATIMAALTLITTTTAMSMTSCSISHNSGNGGNQFTMSWSGVPSISQSTICGHFSSDVSGLISSNGMQQIGSVSCLTDGSNMTTQLTINKQPCSSEANVIVEAMQEALGSAGSLGSGTVCTFTGVC